MNYNPEDPRLTAYALGELPEAERTAFEAGLDAEDRTEIEAIRSLASLLGRELAAEATPSLTDSQRVAIHHLADQPLPKRRRFHWVVWLAAAASFAALLGVFLPALSKSKVVARNTQPCLAEPAVETEAAANVPADASAMEDNAELPGMMGEGGERRLAQDAEDSRAKGRQSQGPAVAEPKSLMALDRAQPAAAPTALAPKPPAPVAMAVAKPAAPPAALADVKQLGAEGRPRTANTEAPAKDGSVAVLKAQAKILQKNGRYADARDKYEQVLLLDPHETDAVRSLRVINTELAEVANKKRGEAVPESMAEVSWRWAEPVTPLHAGPAGPVGGAAIIGKNGFSPMVGAASGFADNIDTDGIAGARTAGQPQPDQPNREAYDRIRDNPFMLVRQEPLSTFSIDVDTASYANVRRYLQQNQLPPPDAVRIEELVNYFDYAYEAPQGERPFSVSVDLAQCPWAPQHRLARVALKGRAPDLAHRPASNLVFLLDVSGSMNEPRKLPLVKETMRLLVGSLSENDRVAIVVYAGASGMVLPSTSCDHPETVLAALDQLQAGGSTNGGSGIQLAYQTAVANFIKGGTNRVILATDGDFNVGISDRGELTRLIEEKAKSGVFLTVLGFGMGNLQDATLEELSGKGNGTYAYIDSVREAQKVMVQQLGGTLLTIAKDVKIQVEFNPTRIGAYRLIGYENRLLAHQDFNDDTKDAGEIGAGLTVTAFYELIPAGVPLDVPGTDALKYQVRALADGAVSDEAMTVKLRYKLPDGDTSTLIQAAVKDQPRNIKEMSDDYVFATSVAAFGMVLRDSPHKGSASLALAEELAQTGARRDPHGYRKEFLELIQRAKALKK